MKNRKYITILLLATLIIGSFISLKVMLKTTPVEKNLYSLDKKGMNNLHRNIPPLFYLNEEGTYFIHPSTSIQAKGTFTFRKNMKLLWHFSIQKGSPVGRILFIVNKNGDEYKKFIVDTKHDYKFKIDILKGDEITIIADKEGSSAGDWGNLKITKYEPYYKLKLYLIPILWLVFFIYLMNKGYIYLAFSSYLGFYLTLIAEKQSFGALSFSEISLYIAFFFLFTFIFVLLYQELQIFKKFKIATILKLIATILIFIVPISFIIFYLTFKKPINLDILFAIYQTHMDEAIGFVKTFIPTPYILGILFIILITGYAFWHQERKERKTIERSLLILIIIVLSGFISEYFLKAKIPRLIHDSYIDYNNQIKRITAFQNKRKTSKVKFNAVKKEKGEVYVLVIGESLNKHNMGIYGHFRNTTPLQLKQSKEDNLLIFNNAYANDGNTMRSLSYALTEANQYNNKDFLESLSFIDIFNKADFDTYWISTQNVIGESNTILSVIIRSSNHIIDLVNTITVETGISSYYDGNTIKALKERISTNKNTLFIVHLYGNHVRYEDRYPEEYAKYKITKPYMIGTDNSKYLYYNTTYDNAVYYNDYVVSSLMNIVKERGGVSAFLYFSDHSEDVARNRGHTARPESFTFAMAEIPFTAWFSSEYIKRYPKKFKNISSNREKLFSNDMIFDTMLGLANIKTDRYNPIYDLSSKEYKLDANKALTLRGKRLYTDPANYYYWRQYNAKLVNDNNISNKVVISDTDTVGKLNDAWSLGFRSFKLNLKYIDSKDSFQTGMKKFDTKGNLIDLLGYFKVDKIKNIFLNLSNLTLNNKKKILIRLENINNKLNIKNKTLILIKEPKFVDYFKQKGWSVVAVNSKLNSTNSDYILLNSKDYKELENNSSHKIVIDNAFSLDDSKLSRKIKSLKKNYSSNNISFILVDFTSPYDK